MLGTAEAMLLGIKLGLEPKMLADIINSSSGRCWASEINNPAPAALEKGAPADRDYNGGCVGLARMTLLRLGQFPSQADEQGS